MKVRGRAIKSIKFFVLKYFAQNYERWLTSLSRESRDIIRRHYVSKYYPMQESLVEPTEKICELFYDGDYEGAWECGRYSAKLGLRTEFAPQSKLAPHELVERAGVILPWYYKGSEMEVAESGKKSAVLEITKFPEPNSLVENRIGGWIERALELLGGENVSVEIKNSLAGGDLNTEYFASWS